MEKEYLDMLVLNNWICMECATSTSQREEDIDNFESD